MKRSKFLLITLSLVLASGVAFAAVLNFSWTNATQNTDGSAIPASGPGSIEATIVSYGPCNAARTALTSITGTVTRTGAQLSGQSPDLPPGVWCAYAQHRNTFGVLSDPSGVGNRVIDPPKPNPPSNFSFGS